MWLYNWLDIFSRARQHQPLTPGERAFLRAWDGFLVLFFLTAVAAIAPIIQGYTSGSSLDWPALIKAVALACFQVIGMTLMKLWKAQGDNGVALQSAPPATVPDAPAVPGVPAGSPGAPPAASAAGATLGDPGATTLMGVMPPTPAPTPSSGTPPEPPMPYAPGAIRFAQAPASVSSAEV